MSFQRFRRQAREDPTRTQEEEVPIWENNMCSTMEEAFLFISILIRNSPQGGHPLLSILSLLPSVTKTKGEAEKAFCVAVTPPAWPQPRVTLPALKPKYL
jgi:hypothetical protein